MSRLRKNIKKRRKKKAVAAAAAEAERRQHRLTYTEMVERIHQIMQLGEFIRQPITVSRQNSILIDMEHHILLLSLNVNEIANRVALQNLVRETHNVDELLDLAKKGDEATFRELASCLGVSFDKIDELWIGTRQRLGK